eukprot:4480872-Heterocapsa_arctica.AAC.1
MNGAKKYLGEAIYKQHKEVTSNITRWADKAMERGAGIAHKWSKGQTVQLQDHMMIDGQKTNYLMRCMDARSSKWAKQWTAISSHSVAQASKQLKSIQERAKEDALLHERLTADMLKSATLQIKSNTARGADHLTPTELLEMPMQGWTHLAEVVREVELNATLPVQ